MIDGKPLASRDTVRCAGNSDLTRNSGKLNGVGNPLPDISTKFAAGPVPKRTGKSPRSWVSSTASIVSRSVPRMKTFIKRFLPLLAALVLAGLFTAAIAAQQCMGVTRAGNRCKNSVSPGSNYCRYHDPAVTHCAATTKDGSPCRNVPESGSIYCRVHKGS